MNSQSCQAWIRTVISGIVLCFSAVAGSEARSQEEGAEVEEAVAAPHWNTGSELPVIAAHYMPWFTNPHTSHTSGSDWKHWQWSGRSVQHDPENRREDGNRDLASTKTPLIGAYTSRSDAVIRYHLRTAKAAGIEALVVIWYGPGSETDEAIPSLMDLAAEEGVRIAICYEEKLNWKPYRDPASRESIVATATEDLDYLVASYAGKPAYLRREGKPVVFQFNSWGEDKLGEKTLLPAEWTRILEQLPEPVSYLRQGEAADYFPPLEGRYIWFSGDGDYLSRFSKDSRELIDQGVLSFFVGMASPEFNDSGVNGWGNGSRITKGEGLSLFKDTFDRAWQGDPEMIQLVTWNDFNEGTVIEPTVEGGFRYLDALETWLGERTGRGVDLDDNREPFRRYLEEAGKEEMAEIPVQADAVLSKKSDLAVEVPNLLESRE